MAARVKVDTDPRKTTCRRCRQTWVWKSAHKAAIIQGTLPLSNGEAKQLETEAKALEEIDKL